MSASENINLDLTYAVLFNLANAYTYNEMYTEALNTYQVGFVSGPLLCVCVCACVCMYV